MKKILILLSFISLPFALNAQLNGLGTFASPYSGTFQGDLQWNTTNFPSGKVFITGDVTIDNELLTIGAGMSIIFVSEGADLIITGTGQLNASGTTGNKITFTADDDNDGIYGETGERWGHVFFNAPSEANQSKIDYCIIEYGDVHTFTDSRGYGGGIFSNFSNLIISNSTIRNNYGAWGGGVFVGASKNPAIRNCNIFNNKSTRAGGGVYCWNSSSSLIENCIFESNQCLETSISYYTGGGLAAQTSCSIKLLNCTFVNNTSTRTEGQALLIHNSPSSLVINSIFWGSSDKQIYCYNSTASIIINCAYRGITYSTGTPVSPVVLNSSNSAPDGPNFTATDGSDWSIKFVSPCRDAGTTPSPTVPNDYIGNPRIGPYDIGAYEVQYSRWLTNASAPTSWTSTSNWEQGFEPGHSGTTGDVVIPSLTSSSFAPDISGTVSISSGKYLILNPGAMATIGTISNSGTLKLESSATGISSLIVNTVTGNAANVQLYLTGGYIGKPALRVGRWHYISSPFDPSTPLSISPFTANTYDLSRWVDGIQSPSSILLGFVGFDGFVYNDSDPSDPGTFWGGTFNTLITGRGYNFWDDLSSFNYSLTGKLNTSDVIVNLDFAGTAYENGFNLLGNPFSTGLSWDYIVDNTLFPDQTGQGIYFTHNNVQYSYVKGVAVPLYGIPASSGIIPPMQGFFVKTYASGKSITLSAAARVHDNIPARYKGQTIIPLVRLEIDKDSLSKDETVVRFDDKALTTLDNEFDALKMFLSASKTSIYSSDGVTKYSINGQPFPGTEIEIPILINLQYSGNHLISTNQLQGLDNYYVTLKDNSTGFIADLKTTPELSFSAAAGTTSGRFILKITNLTTGVENPVVSNNIFNIYPGQNLINIQTIADEWDGKSGSVRLLDLTGKTLTDLQNAEFRKNSLIQMQTPAATGLYVVEIRSGVKRYVGKVVIK